MSDPLPGKQSKKSHLLRPFKGLFSRRNRSPSDNATSSKSASLTDSATSTLQNSPPSHQGTQLVTPHDATASRSASPLNDATPNNTRASEFISASPTSNATSAPQVNLQGTEYTAILELSTTPSGPLTWEHRMKDCGSTAYEGLKMAIQGIYDFSGSFPPLHATAGALLTISKVVDVRGSL